MKTIQCVTVAMMVMALSTGVKLYGADESTQAVSYHEQKVAEYQEKIAAQDAVIAEHEQMAAEYRKKFATSPKLGTPMAVTNMEKHCSAIIRDAEKLKADFQGFKQWHAMRAAELKGQ